METKCGTLLTTPTATGQLPCNASREQNTSTHAHSQCTGCDRGSLSHMAASDLLWTTPISPAYTNRQGRFGWHWKTLDKAFMYLHNTFIQTLRAFVWTWHYKHELSNILNDKERWTIPSHSKPHAHMHTHASTHTQTHTPTHAHTNTHTHTLPLVMRAWCIREADLSAEPDSEGSWRAATTERTAVERGHRWRRTSVNVCPAIHCIPHLV